MIAAPAIVVMVDDDLSEHARVRALLPGDVTLISAYSAVQGIDRCHRLVAEQPGATVVLLLDYKLPDMDGALLAAKLREILPAAPLVALSSISDIAPLMAISGATSTLTKRLSDDALRTQLLAVLARPEAAPPDPVLAPYLAGHATTLAAFRAQRVSVAVLASSRPLLHLLTDAAQQAGIAVGAQSTRAQALDAMLSGMPVRALIADGPAWSRARALAETHQVPLLVVAMALSTAISLSIEPMGVLLSPEPAALSDALDALLAGEPYADRRIVAAYEALELTLAERPLLAYILRDLPIAQAARDLHLSESAARKARARAFARLGAERLDEVRTALDDLLVA
jgi:DNA-binding NarL/FixJ family response regulator/DNA-binding CsgD family transcriptional regulator